MSEPCDLGLIGLAVMGENLALNIESRGNRVATIQIRKRTLGGSAIDITVSPRGRPPAPSGNGSGMPAAPAGAVESIPPR